MQCITHHLLVMWWNEIYLHKHVGVTDFLLVSCENSIFWQKDNEYLLAVVRWNSIWDQLAWQQSKKCHTSCYITRCYQILHQKIVLAYKLLVQLSNEVFCARKWGCCSPSVIIESDTYNYFFAKSLLTLWWSWDAILPKQNLLPLTLCQSWDGVSCWRRDLEYDLLSTCCVFANNQTAL